MIEIYYVEFVSCKQTKGIYTLHDLKPQIKDLKFGPHFHGVLSTCTPKASLIRSDDIDACHTPLDGHVWTRHTNPRHMNQPRQVNTLFLCFPVGLCPYVMLSFPQAQQRAIQDVEDDTHVKILLKYLNL